MATHDKKKFSDFFHGQSEDIFQNNHGIFPWDFPWDISMGFSIEPPWNHRWRSSAPPLRPGFELCVLAKVAAQHFNLPKRRGFQRSWRSWGDQEWEIPWKIPFLFWNIVLPLWSGGDQEMDLGRSFFWQSMINMGGTISVANCYCLGEPSQLINQGLTLTTSTNDLTRDHG